MFEHIEDLPAGAVLAAAVGCRREADRAETRLLELAVHWADLHAVVEEQSAAGIPVPGMQQLVPLAGEGTPKIAEFAPAEFGAALGLTTYSAACYIGEGLELRHRLPRTWERVLDGRLTSWRARRIAENTMCLSPQAAAWVDAARDARRQPHRHGDCRRAGRRRVRLHPLRDRRGPRPSRRP